MKAMLRKFLSAFVVGIGLFAGIGGMSLVSAASLSLLTGPQPGADLVSILNTLIVNINSTLAPLGTNTMSAAFALWGGTGTLSSTGTVQFLGSGVWEATSTSNCGAAASNSNMCLDVIDASGNIRYIPTF